MMITFTARSAEQIKWKGGIDNFQKLWYSCCLWAATIDKLWQIDYQIKSKQLKLMIRDCKENCLVQDRTCLYFCTKLYQSYKYCRIYQLHHQCFLSFIIILVAPSKSSFASWWFSAVAGRGWMVYGRPKWRFPTLMPIMLHRSKSSSLHDDDVTSPIF